MILTGREIEKQCRAGRIAISDFDAARVTTNSYDLLLGDQLLRYRSETLDARRENEYEVFPLPEEGYLMQKGEFLLAETADELGSDHYVPTIHGRSGVARLGLFVHINSELVDVGYYGKLPLQLFATLPIRIYPRMGIAQVSFWQMSGDPELCYGQYAGASEPNPFPFYKDFPNGNGAIAQASANGL
ncbi:MAG: dCTP deaminase [Cyanobacteria bacterium J06641_5]